jgi:hypothetical protein
MLQPFLGSPEFLGKGGFLGKSRPSALAAPGLLTRLLSRIVGVCSPPDCAPTK